MPLTEAERKKLFDEKRAPIEQGVRDLHAPYHFPSDWKDFSFQEVATSLSKWWKQPTDWNSIKTSAGKAVSNAPQQGVSYAISKIPLLGTPLAKAWDAAVDYCKAKHHQNQMAVDPKAKKEYLIEKGMSAYIEALGKVERSEAEFRASAATFKCCSDFAQALGRFYYWKYRLERLRYYHDLVYGFCQDVEKQLSTSTVSLDKEEVEIASKWSKYMFENPDWHMTLCRGANCFYPWDRAEISGPYNVVHKPGFLPAGPNASLKPVPVLPTKADPNPGPPPLPLRNPQHFANYQKNRPK
jgi:hypothetical protein